MVRRPVFHLDVRHPPRKASIASHWRTNVSVTRAVVLAYRVFFVERNAVCLHMQMVPEARVPRQSGLGPGSPPLVAIATS